MHKKNTYLGHVIVFFLTSVLSCARAEWNIAMLTLLFSVFFIVLQIFVKTGKRTDDNDTSIGQELVIQNNG